MNYNKPSAMRERIMKLTDRGINVPYELLVKFKLHSIFPPKGVQVERIMIKGREVDIPTLVIRPQGSTGLNTGVMWIHGGGYAMGHKELVFTGRAMDLVLRHGAVVVSPDYRLSTNYPFPAGINDCYDVLCYIKEHAVELGIRDDQIMVGGESAGGGLTAALCMMARDKGEVNVAFQMPLYPMLDNFDTESSKDNHAKLWNTEQNHEAWRLYLRDDYGKEVSPYASPSRQTDYTNLPPAYTFVGTAEPFLDETVTFVENLKKAGVEAEIDLYEAMYHSFDMAKPYLPISVWAINRFNEAFAYAKKNYFAPQN